MTDQEHDVEDLIAALRDDLPSRDDDRRARARLASAGVVVGSVATLTELGSAAASTSLATGNTAAATSAAAMGSGAAVGSTAGSLSVAAGSAVQAGGLAAQAGGFTLVFAKVAALGGGTKAALVTALAVGAGYPAVTSLLPPSEPAVVSAAASARGVRAPEQRSVRAPEGRPVPQRAPVLGQSSEHQPKLARFAESGRIGVRTGPVTAAAPVVPAAPVASAAPVTAAAPVTRAAPDARVAVPAITGTSALEAETALIERALRAARAGDRDSAAAWLSEHQRRYPNGALAPERQRAFEQLQH